MTIAEAMSFMGGRALLDLRELPPGYLEVLVACGRETHHLRLTPLGWALECRPGFWLALTM